MDGALVLLVVSFILHRFVFYGLGLIRMLCHGVCYSLALLPESIHAGASVGACLSIVHVHLYHGGGPDFEPQFDSLISLFPEHIFSSPWKWYNSKL